MLRPEVWLPPEPVEGGIVGEGGVDIAGADAGHRMGKGRARERIRIGAEIGLRQQVVDRVNVLAHRRGGYADEGVVDQRVGEAGTGVRAGEQVAQEVIVVGKILDRVAGPGQRRGQPASVGIEALVGDNAVAGGLLGEVQLGIKSVGGPLHLAGGGVVCPYTAPI